MKKRVCRTTITRFGLCLLAGSLLSTQAAAPNPPQGVITALVYLNTGAGNTVPDLINNPAFPNSPSLALYEPYFELWATGDIDTPAPGGPNYVAYGAQLAGYFYPPSTRDYVFYLCSDDQSLLYLSTDEDPANKKLIAAETAWSNPRQYGVSSGLSDLTAKRSDQYAGSEWPTPGGMTLPVVITLTAGQPYYIEALMKQGGGGDNLSVSIDGIWPIGGEHLSTFDKQSGAVFVETPPQSQTVGEGTPVTFSVIPNGSPMTSAPFAGYSYQWALNGTPIPGATSQACTLARTPLSDNGGQFACTVSGAAGSAVTSASATLTVMADTTAPELVGVRASGDLAHVRLSFSKPMLASTAQDPANYSIQGLTITAAVLAMANDSEVILTTSAQAEGTVYTVVMNNLKDQTAAGNAIAANTRRAFSSWVFSQGGVLHEYWDNIWFGLPSLTSDPRYPANPTYSTLEPRFEYPSNAGNEAGDNYGNQLSGWLRPPETGQYVFFVNSDDQSELYLSTDENPANLRLIARETGWSSPRNWLAVNSGDPTTKRSDQFVGSLWPTPNVITLTAGQLYYIVARHIEGGGGDNIGVTWRLPSASSDPLPGSPPIDGQYIGSYVNPANRTVTGQSDLWLADMPDRTTASQNLPDSVDVAPNQSPLFAGSVTPGQTLSFWAMGGVGNYPTCPLFGPEGNPLWIVSHRAGAEHGISDIIAPMDSLLGVFLDGAQPDLTPAPSAILDFSSPASRDYLTLAPQLKQVFFIGDGITSSSYRQQIIVPDGATRLYLGTMDSFEWNNNVGAFNVEITIVDRTPPTTTATPSPGPNVNGWNNTTVTVALAATDNPGGSGVRSIAYSLAGAQPGGGSAPGNTVSIAIAAEGITTITFQAQDNAGNLETPKTLTVKIDKTPPTLACSVTPGVLWPPNHKLVALTASLTPSDSLSGPAGLTLTSVTSNEPDNGLGDGDQPNDIQGFLVGTACLTGQVRAERSGTGKGRVYTLTYQATDKAGNSATCSATVRVPHAP